MKQTFKQFFNLFCEAALTDDEMEELKKRILDYLQKYPKALKISKQAIKFAILQLRDIHPPIYYTLLSQFTIVPRSNIDTMGVDEKGNLSYNPMFVVDWLLQMSDNLDGEPSQQGLERLKGVLVHEAMHVINSTFERMKQTHPRSAQRIAMEKEEHKDYTIHTIGNYAYDLVINRDLLLDGYTLPETGIIPVFDPPLSQYNSDKHVDRKAYFTFDFTTKKDDKHDIRKFDITKFSAEKCFYMFAIAIQRMTNKLFNQGMITKQQHAQTIKFLDEVINDE